MKLPNSASRPSLEPKLRPCPSSPHLLPWRPALTSGSNAQLDSNPLRMHQDAPAEKFIFQEQGRSPGLRVRRQSSPLMIRLLPPQARDPEGGGRAAGPGS